MKKKYAIRGHEAGIVIDEFATLTEAETALDDYIKMDKAEGTYTPRFYEIYDIELEQIKEISQ